MKTRNLIALGLAAVATAAFGWCVKERMSKKNEPKRSLDSEDEVRERAVTTCLLQQPELSDYCQDEVSLPEITTPSVQTRLHSNPGRSHRKTKGYHRNDDSMKMKFMNPNRDQVQHAKQIKLRKYGRCA